MFGGVLTQRLDATNDVWNSEDGKNWTKVTDSAPWPKRWKHLTFIYKGKMHIFGGMTGISARSGIKLYSDIWSSEDGKNWTKVIDKLPGFPRQILSRVSVIGESIFISGGNEGFKRSDGNIGDKRDCNKVFISHDGKTWTNEVASWPARSAHTMLYFKNKLWVINGTNGKAGFFNDVWNADFGTFINPKPNHITTNSTFKGETIYSQSVKITYTIPEKGIYSLKAYNIFGKKISTLQSMYHQSGQHTFLWDCMNQKHDKIPKGMYILHLNGKISQNCKIIVK